MDTRQVSSEAIRLYSEHRLIAQRLEPQQQWIVSEQYEGRVRMLDEVEAVANDFGDAMARHRVAIISGNLAVDSLLLQELKSEYLANVRASANHLESKKDEYLELAIEDAIKSKTRLSPIWLQ